MFDAVRGSEQASSARPDGAWVLARYPRILVASLWTRAGQATQHIDSKGFSCFDHNKISIDHPAGAGRISTSFGSKPVDKRLASEASD
ncbi:hypothetical protein [Herbaspirillum sp. VT-16-41]|uniref:hypothetical protein n=1 Tax=Herbaspirillum sp. VT-16-41 TaxID=1953765 RepID=UPI0011154BC1|nr:hypothetical protein [Herbaspirillum sp. VT-16-41]